MKENTLVYGVDVGGTTIKFGLLDGPWEPAPSEQHPYGHQRTGEEYLPQIAHWIRRQDVPFREIAGVGWGCRGRCAQTAR